MYFYVCKAESIVAVAMAGIDSIDKLFKNSSQVNAVLTHLKITPLPLTPSSTLPQSQTIVP